MYNKVQLIGNLGKDPELRYTPSGTAVATFPLATSEKRKSKDGEVVEKTEWHKIVTWRLLAEHCHDYLLKGRLIFVEGKIQTRSYEDRDGNKRYVTEIIADQVKFLEKCEIQTGESSPALHQSNDNGWTDEDPQF
ncbi:single-stranded DNA-binding protein [Geopsychrobacter electrodiphilus]|uniref:single-stranded DNA-binding protein n=1 Tax=Geopsychrobacter electrodiphilus TaxID=225196 RepID=UPI00036A0454|nr:single-stranded DNA-binding protein [Geopsychrobacter electrodiphilus]